MPCSWQASSRLCMTDLKPKSREWNRTTCGYSNVTITRSSPTLAQGPTLASLDLPDSPGCHDSVVAARLSLSVTNDHLQVDFQNE